MKRLFMFIAAVGMACSMIAQVMFPSIEIKDNLNGYEYFYVTPTNSVVSSSGIHSYSSHTSSFGFNNSFSTLSGGKVQTVVPSDMLIGSLMNNGYNVVSSITPELAEKTLIITYGYVGKRQMNLFSHASEIILNIQNAKTQKIVASIKAEGWEDTESECIREALNSALMMLFYAINPKIEYEIDQVYKKSIYFTIHNKTPNLIEKMKFKISYFDNDILVHQQEVIIKEMLLPDKSTQQFIKRDKIAQNKNYQINIQIIEYK